MQKSEKQVMFADSPPDFFQSTGIENPFYNTCHPQYPQQLRTGAPTPGYQVTGAPTPGYQPSQPMQPGVVYQVPPNVILQRHISPPPDYMNYAIIALLLFFPVGWFAYKKSRQCRYAILSGFAQTAMKTSAEARRLSIISYICGLGCLVALFIILGIVFKHKAP